MTVHFSEKLFVVASMTHYSHTSPCQGVGSTLCCGCEKEAQSDQYGSCTILHVLLIICHMSLHTCIDIHICMYLCVCVFIYIYIYTHIPCMYT